MTTVVEHWYDFVCPFCYVAQDRNAVLRWAGVDVVDLPFMVHPEITPGGRSAPARRGPMYELLTAEARQAGLNLVWSDRIPYSRPALIRAEIVRRHDPARHAEFCRAVFDAYFGHGHDIEQHDVLEACATEADVDASLIADPALLRMGADDVDRSRRRASTLGVRATPSWLIDGELVEGLRSHHDFQRMARELTGTAER